jgi:tRNA (cmo5U34)-methyltransferase
MAEHRVLEHLGLAARDYDVGIRRYIPAYDAMVAAVLELIAKLPAPYVIDLGTGTGALGVAIAERVTSARVRLLDIDPAMLEVARARAERVSDRVELHAGSFDDPLPTCDAVVASLALHHVPERERKTALYRRIHDALRPGGIVAVADATVHDAGPEHAAMFELWRDHLIAQGFTASEADGLFAQWAGEDRYYPLVDELAMLRSAGFSRADCFWKHGPMAVYGAYRA